MKKMPLALIITVLVVIGTGDARAALVAINNPSFEDTGGVILGAGGFTGNGEGLTGWVIAPGAFVVGLFKPAGIFFSAIPDGEHVAYSHGRNISQVLSAVLTANTRYTLEVGVGDANNTAFGGYRIQLRVGGTTLAEDINSLLPPNGEFTTSILTFVALADNPLLGQNIEIVLESFASETSFDLVTLNASLVPLPAPLALFGLALAGLGIHRRKSA